MEIAAAKFLVTGGGRGIGREIARALAAKGAEPLLVGRDQSSLEATRAQIGDTVHTMRCDLAVPEEVERLLAICRQDHPDLAGLINNAAIQHELDLLDADSDRTNALAHEEIAVNLAALVSLSIGLLPSLRAQPHSVIVNITSGLAFAPKEASPVYCATKAACHAFSQTLRYQCQRHAANVHVLEAIMPMVDTDMTAGRGRGKISPVQAADAVVAAIEADREEAWIGKAAALRVLRRILPGIANRMLRGNGIEAAR